MTRLRYQLDQRIARLALETGWRAMRNRRRYGADAPRPGQMFSIDPAQVIDRLVDNPDAPLGFSAFRSGQVIDGDWDLARKPFADYFKHLASHAHFIEGQPWEKTAMMQVGMNFINRDGVYNTFRTEEALLARYHQLDALWAATVAANKLPTEAENPAKPWDQIVVHIDRDGQPLFGNQGFHRMSISKLAKLDRINVLLGVVHPGAIGRRTMRDLISQKA